MRYKTIMLSMEGYAKLARVRKALRRKFGLKFSFNEVISELVGRGLEFSELDEGLKAFVSKFADRVSKLRHVEGILLFGSVAKGTYNEYSDIDVLVIAKDGRGSVLKEILAITAAQREEGRALMQKGLPSLISPVILGANNLKDFRPFYFDFADYGIILYEKNDILADFIYSIKKMKYRRENVNNTEVITW